MTTKSFNFLPFCSVPEFAKLRADGRAKDGSMDFIQFRDSTILTTLVQVYMKYLSFDKNHDNFLEPKELHAAFGAGKLSLKERKI